MGWKRWKKKRSLQILHLSPSLCQLYVREKARDKDSESISKSKVDVEDEEIDIDDEEDSDDESVASTASEKPKTLKQKKVKLSIKYPDKCSREEAQLFFPTSQETMHDTGVPAKYIGSRENLPQYKGLYCCLFNSCDYGAQVRASTCSHIRRVHLGHAIGCRYCPAKGWWQARYWVNHMKSQHPDLPKFEVVELPPNPVAVKIEPELFIQEEHFTIPVPKSQAETPVDEPSTKRFKQEVEPSQNPVGDKKAPTRSVASDSQAGSVTTEHVSEEFESTETYFIES